MSKVFRNVVNGKQITVVLEQDEWLSIYIDEQYIEQCVSYNEAMKIVEHLAQVC